MALISPTSALVARIPQKNQALRAFQSLFRSVALTSQDAQIKNSRQSISDLTKQCKGNSVRSSNYFDRCSIWRRRTTEYSSASSLLLYLKRKINSLVNIETLSLNSFLRKSGYPKRGAFEPCLVCQDGRQRNGRQNFKFFAWQDIAGDRLLIDTARPARPR